MFRRLWKPRSTMGEGVQVLDQLTLKLGLDAEQAAKLDELKAGLIEAARLHEAAREAAAPPTSIAAWLENAETAASAAFLAVKRVRADFEAFYAALDSVQRAAVDRFAPCLSSGGWGLRRLVHG